LNQKLEQIINYTAEQSRSYLTASDVDNIISQEYLDKLQESREIEGVYLANSLQHIDLSQEDSTAQEVKIKQVQEKDRLEQYRLEQGSLFRVYLIKQREDLYTCVFSNHHAILDGWSNPILLGYVHNTYLRLENQETILLTVDRSYEDTQKYLQQHLDNDKDYWNKYLSQIDERSDLSSLLSVANKHNSLRVNEYKHIRENKEETLTITSNLYDNIKKLSREEGVTLNAILQYVWHRVLNIYSNSNHTVVGTTVSGRNLQIDNIESSVGLYISTLPLIVDHDKQIQKSIIESIKDIQDNINEISSKSNINLAKLQKGAIRLFDSLFIYENYPNSANKEEEKRLKIRFKGAIEKLDYPLGVTAYEANNQLIFALQYAGELFSRDSIEHLLSIFKTLLEQIVNNPYQEGKNLNYLNQEQYRKITRIWNDTTREYPNDKHIYQLFEQQVESTPDSIAIICNGHQLTYKDLNQRANQLAHYLRKIGIEKEAIISLIIDRGINFLIAVLAIFKAKAAYLPIEPTFPIKRIQYILTNSKTKFVILEKKYESITFNTSNNLSFQPIYIEDICMEHYSIKNASFDKNYSPDDLAYVIYTSGSTGTPKGAMVEQQGMINHLYAKIQDLNLSKTDIIAQTAPQSFDISVWQFLAPLVVGGCVCVVPTSVVSDLDLLLHEINKNNVTIFQVVPSLMRILLQHVQEYENKSKALKKLRWLIPTGEELLADLVQKWLNIYPLIPVLNAYGPTECSDDVTHYKVEGMLSHITPIVPIGRPVANTQIYILDRCFQIVPIGVVGELYVGGDGVGRGYLYDPERTASAFLLNPFTKDHKNFIKKSPRLYKTGDLARYLPDGNIEFLGRVDNQIKIHGHRIELGEIEACFRKHENVAEVVVVPNIIENKHLRLVAYVVPRLKYSDKLYKKSMESNNSQTDLFTSSFNKYSNNHLESISNRELTESLKEYLKEVLPEYMIPSDIIVIKELPLNANGKIDRKALPTPDFLLTTVDYKDSYVAPRNELESRICEIWAEVLGLPKDKVGINDDFFRLGGDSIISIQLVSKLRQRLSLNISVRDIFNYKNIKILYDNVLSKKSSSTKLNVKTEQGTLSGEVLLLPVQQWFFDS
ncbi:MAG: amino acid adenylation domain-containing protein, partial [Alphaproteobacteria bacterium]|nr:amino acid adenylation domain-containing protein [Alphaproteobacteria bacterium]